MTTNAPAISDATLENILKLAKNKASAAEVYYISSQDTPVEFENNRLKSLSTTATEGIALRVICDGRLGFASSTDLTRLEELVDAAVQTAEIGDAIEYDLAKDLQVNLPDSDYTPPNTESLVATGEDLIAKILEYNPDILASVSFHVRSGKTKLATTNNVYAQRNSKILSAVVSGNLVRGEDFLEIYSYEVTKDSQPNYDSLLQTLLQKYQDAENQATIKSGSYPVLFMPRAVASTLGSLFDTILSGRAVVQKASPLIDKIGQELFDPRLTIFEDPTLGISATPFDDEGTPTSTKVLIDQGVVKQFYWDRHWSALAGVESTGNGFRGGLSRPSPDLVNFCMKPGKTSLEDLIAGMEQGLIVDQVLGAGQSNQLAGEFSVNLDLGYKVEQGKIVGRVKNTMVAGSIFEAFKNLVDLSDTPQWIGGGAYLPAILFANLGVASRG